MGIADLTGPRAKLSWAQEHEGAFHKELDAFVEQKANTISIKYGRDGAWHVVYVGPVPKVPQRLALLVGDCLNNIRSALDHLVYQLVLREDEKPQQCNCFPICETREEFVEKVIAPAQRGKRHPLRGIPINGDAWTLIERAQPFQCSQLEGCMLGLLAKFTNLDKHNVLLVQYVLTNMPHLRSGISWRYGFKPIEERFATYPISPKHPTEIMRFRFAPTMAPDANIGACMKVNGGIALDPTFGTMETQVSLEFLNVTRIEVTQILDQAAALPRVKDVPADPASKKIRKKGWWRLFSSMW